MARRQFWGGLEARRHRSPGQAERRPGLGGWWIEAWRASSTPSPPPGTGWGAPSGHDQWIDQTPGVARGYAEAAPLGLRTGRLRRIRASSPPQRPRQTIGATTKYTKGTKYTKRGIFLPRILRIYANGVTDFQPRNTRWDNPNRNRGRNRNRYRKDVKWDSDTIQRSNTKGILTSHPALRGMNFRDFRVFRS